MALDEQELRFFVNDDFNDFVENSKPANIMNKVQSILYFHLAKKLLYSHRLNNISP